MTEKFRTETDSFGEIKVPADALYGANTQRAVQNFPISGTRFPRAFLRALGMIKGAAASANREFGLLDRAVAEAIESAAFEVEEGTHDAHFPIDIYQTGSGTSTNMNANEVIARLASARAGVRVHPNDHVNLGQSSNDVIPAAIHLSANLEITKLLLGLGELAETIDRKAAGLTHVVKNGRTHLMDALPVRMDQELSGWAQQIRDSIARIESSRERLRLLAIGGTAVGTGVNTHPQFGGRVASILAQRTGLPLRPSPNYFASLSSQDTSVEVSGQLKALAVALMKIVNDLRWMNSGTNSGLAEIRLPALQAGSSIMPGKVNPVVPEAAAMVCARVIGNDATITIAGQSGNFQLNVMLPVIGATLLESIALLTNVAGLLAERAIEGFEVNVDRLLALAERNPILATVLNSKIGYDAGAKLVKQAIAEDRSIKDVAREMTGLSKEELDRLLDPMSATQRGWSGG
jgi:fumarate hydratase, class II